MDIWSNSVDDFDGIMSKLNRTCGSYPGSHLQLSVGFKLQVGSRPVRSLFNVGLGGEKTAYVPNLGRSGSASLALQTAAATSPRELI